MTPSDRFAISEDVVSREIAGEVVLMDLESGLYFGLDEVGARIWQLLDKEAQDIAAICDAIVAEYDASRDVVEADTMALMSDLLERGLIRPAAAQD